MSIATNSLRTYLFRIANGIIGFLIGVLVSRLLGPDGKGHYSAIFLYYSIYSFVFGNLGQAIIYQLTRLKENIRTVLISSSIYSLSVGFISVLAFWIFCRFSPWFHPGSIWLVVGVLPFTLVLTNLSGVFWGLNRITTLNWIGIGAGFFQFLLLAASYGIYKFTGAKIGVDTAIAFWFAGQLVTIVTALWLARAYWLPPLKPFISKPVLLAMLGFGWQISLNNIVSFLNSRIDSLIVQWKLPVQQYGLYSVAVGGAEILWYASGAIAVAICAHVGSANREQAGRLTAKAIRHTLLINIPMAVLMWSIAWFIPLIYGGRFSMSVVPYRILLPGVLAYSIAGIFSTFFTTQLGKPRIPLVIALIGMVIDLSGSLLLIPRLGIAGGAWANTISYLISIMVAVIIFCKESGISLWQLFRVSEEDLADYRLLWRTIQHFFVGKFR